MLGPGMRFTESGGEENRACDECVRSFRLCARIVKIGEPCDTSMRRIGDVKKGKAMATSRDEKYELVFYPLPERLREGVSWDSVGFWIMEDEASCAQPKSQVAGSNIFDQSLRASSQCIVLEVTIIFTTLYPVSLIDTCRAVEEFHFLRQSCEDWAVSGKIKGVARWQRAYRSCSVCCCTRRSGLARMALRLPVDSPD